MEKKLPKVFAGKVDKKAGNNKDVFYSSKDIPEKKDNSRSALVSQEKTKNVNQKINEIFSSSRYVYKADVELTLKSGVVEKRIVGKNNTHLITIDNELIPISDIVDIKYK